MDGARWKDCLSLLACGQDAHHTPTEPKRHSLGLLQKFTSFLVASRGLLAAHPTHQEPLVQLFPAGSAAHSTVQPQQLPGSSAAAGSAAFYRRAHVPVTLHQPLQLGELELWEWPHSAFLAFEFSVSEPIESLTWCRNTQITPMAMSLCKSYFYCAASPLEVFLLLFSFLLHWVFHLDCMPEH